MNSWIDFKYACRLLGQKPGFTSLTIAIMAIGFGLCILMYSSIYSIAIKTLPLPDGERMVMVDLKNKSQREAYDPLAIHALSQQQTVFEMFGYFEPSYVNVSSSNQATFYKAARIRPNFFDYTSTYPNIGRAFNDLDMQENAKPVVIISHALWQSHFGGKNNIVGGDIYVEGVVREVVGVMPAGFAFPINEQLWMPLQGGLERADAEVYLQPYGKLNPGVAKIEATAELISIYKRLQTDDPDRFKSATPVVIEWPMSQVDNLTVVFAAMLVSVFLILSLACINVANLLYSRASERAKETAIRVALGAPTGRLIMQMMWESLIICIAGGIIAILSAQLGLGVIQKVLVGFYPEGLPFYLRMSIDYHIALVAVILIGVTALITGFLPAWKIISSNFDQILRDGTRSSQSRRSSKINSVVVVFEVLVACALLTSSAMISVAINQAGNIDYGVDSENLLTAYILPPESAYPTDNEKRLFFNALLKDLNAQPDIDFVVGAFPLPGQGGGLREIETEQFEKTQDNQYPRTFAVHVMPDAVKKLGVELIEGRFFEESDDQSSQNVALVTTSFVDQFLTNGSNILGQQVRFVTGSEQDKSEWMTIVGVVEHLVLGSPYRSSKNLPSVFVPMNQNLQQQGMSVAIKGVEQSPDDMVDNLNQSLQRLDRHLPATLVKSYDELFKQNTALVDFLSRLFNLFAIAALSLACAGIYGVISNSVNLRTHEIGIRRAMGASDQHILIMLMKQGWAQLILGAIMGLPIAYLIGQSILSVIGGDSLAVYAMYGIIPAIIAAVVSLATYIPARRAVDMEPTTALRYE